jgi:hypothetical protein
MTTEGHQTMSTHQHQTPSTDETHVNVWPMPMSRDEVVADHGSGGEIVTVVAPIRLSFRSREELIDHVQACLLLLRDDDEGQGLEVTLGRRRIDVHLADESDLMIVPDIREDGATRSMRRVQLEVRENAGTNGVHLRRGHWEAAP